MKRALVLGSGGREHAFVYALSKSPLLDKLYCAPGNPGTALLAENVPLKISDFKAIASLIKDENIDIEFSDSQRKLITTDTKYLLSLIVGNSTLENKFSDRGNLIVSVSAFDNSADIDGLFEVTEMRIVRHNEII